MVKRVVILIACFVLLIISLTFFSSRIRSILNLSPINNKSAASSVSVDAIPQYLHLPSGFKLTLYSNFPSSPRVMATDNSNTLFVSFPDSGKIMALINSNNGNQPNQSKDIITSLNYPHGIAYYNNKLFVAEENQVSRYDWNKKTNEAKLEKILFKLPTDGIHRSKSISFDSKGNMYVSIGSSCNVCEETDPERAAIIISDFEGNNPHRFATGLRNTVFMTENPDTQEVWGTDMERDQLGDDLPPDEINILKNGADYGWPYCYGDGIKDIDFINKNRLTVPQNICQKSVSPIFQIPAHSAPLGLVFVNSSKYPLNLQHDLLVAYHGSWNSSTPKGYKVVHLKINNNSVVYSEDFITGFIQNNSIIGRPVDLVFDSQNNLYLSDDKANAIYKISYFP